MSKINWEELAGMSENAAEEYMIKNWGEIPDEWNNPLFRDQVTGIQGQAEIEAHMNFGELTYGSQNKLGEQARGTWDKRNVAGQGHPAEAAYKNVQRTEKKG